MCLSTSCGALKTIINEGFSPEFGKVASLWVLAPHLRCTDQGVHPASARPGLACDDRNDPDYGNPDVRVRDQYHTPRSSNRRTATGTQRSLTFNTRRAAEHALLQGYTDCPKCD